MPVTNHDREKDSLAHSGPPSESILPTYLMPEKQDIDQTINAKYWVNWQQTMSWQQHYKNQSNNYNLIYDGLPNT